MEERKITAIFIYKYLIFNELRFIFANENVQITG